MKKIYNVHLATKSFILAGQESRECCVFISDVGICGIYLYLTLGTANFKQLDESCSSGISLVCMVMRVWSVKL